MLKKKIAKTLLAAMIATSAVTPLYMNMDIATAAEAEATNKQLKIKSIEKSLMSGYTVRLEEEGADPFSPSKPAERINEIKVNNVTVPKADASNPPKGKWKAGTNDTLTVNVDLKKDDKLQLYTEDKIFTLTIINPNANQWSADKVADVDAVVVTTIKDSSSPESGENVAPPSAVEEEKLNLQVENFQAKPSFGRTSLIGTLTPVAEAQKVDKITFTPRGSSAATPMTKVSSTFNIYDNEFYIGDDGRFVIAEKNENGIKDGIYSFMVGDKLVGAFEYNSTAKTFTKVENPEKVELKQYYTILRGAFEDAHTKQKKYDSVSGASLAVSENKNSDVTVYTTNDKEAYENYLKDPKTFNSAKWTILRESGAYNKADDIKVHITEGCGMRPVYGLTDSKITLSSLDTKNGLVGPAGNYEVWLTFKDVNGNTVTTNKLPFIVHDYDKTTLTDRINNAKPRVMQDGKKIWDMTPWAIDNFGGENSTVTIPSDWKAIYGSHESGTYGVLGHDVPEGSPTDQTLIIGAGTNLTLVNMDLRSGIKVIVENGGQLSLKHSVVGGQIIVRDGGVFSMNYDPYHKKPETGSSIQGQVIVEDGGILRNSTIVSNSNFLANDNKARHNEGPVVKVVGKGIVEGNVFIRGDESATGNNAEGSDVLSGQPALEVVEGAKLDVKDGATLIANGGGQYITTTKGGNAAIVNGTIEGEGTFVAVAGKSGVDRDGTAGIAGTGNIATKKAVIHGGVSRSNKHKGGKAVADGIKIADTTKASLKDGVVDTKETEGIEPLLLGFGAGAVDIEKHFTDTKAKVEVELAAVPEKTEDNVEPETPGTETPGTETPGTANQGTNTINLIDDITKVKVQATIAATEKGLTLFSEAKGFDNLTEEEKTALINATYNGNGSKVFNISQKDIAKFFEVHLQKKGQKADVKGKYDVMLPVENYGDYYVVHLKHGENGKIEADVQKTSADKDKYVTFKGATSFSIFAAIPAPATLSDSWFARNMNTFRPAVNIVKPHGDKVQASGPNKATINAETKSPKKQTTNTGDESNLLIYLAALMTAGTLALLMRKRKLNK